jgi:hypothetical protein
LYLSLTIAPCVPLPLPFGPNIRMFIHLSFLAYFLDGNAHLEFGQNKTAGRMQHTRRLKLNWHSGSGIRIETVCQEV